MSRIISFVATTALLSGCGPSNEEIETARQAEARRLEVIEKLCRDVGGKAFALANDGKQPIESLFAIQRGAEAECALKYLGRK